MKKDFHKLLMMGLIAVSLMMLGAIYIWAPVCDGLLKLATGNMVHMKCFYTAQAGTILAILLLVLSIAALAAKKYTVITSVMVIVLGIMIIAVTYESLIGIGVCKKVMACHQTAFWLRIGGGLAILIGIGSMFKKRQEVLE